MGFLRGGWTFLYFISSFLSLMVQEIWPIGLVMTYQPINILTYQNVFHVVGSLRGGWTFLYFISYFLLQGILPIGLVMTYQPINILTYQNILHVVGFLWDLLTYWPIKMFGISNFLSLKVKEIWPKGPVMKYKPIDLSKCLACCGVSKGWLNFFELHKLLPISYG